MVVQNGFTEGTIPYQTLKYYEADCLIDNPLSFLHDLEYDVAEAVIAVDYIFTTLNSANYTELVEICGEGNNIYAANNTLFFLEQTLTDLRGTLVASIDLTGCSSISPIFRRVFFGDTCFNSVEGLSWLFGGTASMVVLGLIILSTRAGLFNPVIRGRRRKRREKEFEDYKEYMGKFYDTTQWRLDYIPEIFIEINNDESDNESNVEQSEGTQSSSSGSPANSRSRLSPNGQLFDVSLSSPAMAPTMSGDDGSVFVNLAAPDTVFSNSHLKDHTSVDDDHQEAEDDAQSKDDDSYDSTYSSASDESDLRSEMTAISAVSNLLKKASDRSRPVSSLLYDGHDDILSTLSSASSKFGRLFARRSPKNGIIPHSFSNQETPVMNPASLYMRRSDDDDEDEDYDVDNSFPNQKTPEIHAPSLYLKKPSDDDEDSSSDIENSFPNQKTPFIKNPGKRYMKKKSSADNNNKDSSSDDNNSHCMIDDDSAIGVMLMTPPPMQIPISFGRNSKEEISPEEIAPLSPPSLELPENNNNNKQKKKMTTRKKILAALSRRR